MTNLFRVQRANSSGDLSQPSGYVVVPAYSKLRPNSPAAQGLDVKVNEMAHVSKTPGFPEFDGAR